MSKILVTGMSGTGKSTVLGVLAERGYDVVDTDTDAWSQWVTLPDGSLDWVWREDEIATLLAGSGTGALFVAGCKSNQGRFYDRFDHVVLLSAPADVILRRIAARDTHPYGKDPRDRARILEHIETVEPLLRATATVEIDTRAPVESVADALEALAGPPAHEKHVRRGDATDT